MEQQPPLAVGAQSIGAVWSVRGVKAYMCLCAYVVLTSCDRKHSDIGVTIGTSAAARFVRSAAAPTTGSKEAELELDPGLWCYRIDTHRLLVGGALTDGGSLMAWLAHLVGCGVPRT